MRRVLTAAVGIALTVAVVSFAPFPVFAAAVAVLVLLAYREFDRLATAAGFPGDPAVGLPAAPVFALAPWLDLTHPPFRLQWLEPLLLVLVIACLLRLTFARRPFEEGLRRAGATLTGVLWCGFLFSYVTALGLVAVRGDLVWVLLLGVWGNDTLAYVFGRAFGRARLAPRISPGKTWVGLAGGVVGAVLGVAAAGWVGGYAERLHPVHALGAGVAIALAALAGDLAESALKRGAGVKDSGAFFPGHGGVLDRLDSLLFAAPVLYHYLRWVAGPLPP